MNITRITTTTIIAVLLAGLAGVNAGTPDRDWPSVEVSPILDVPMRDTAITRGPDGTYYLTGTFRVPVVGRAVPSPPQPATNDGALKTARPTHDFENSHIIKLWKSTDLKKWKEIGVVWDWERDVVGPKGDAKPDPIVWHRQAHKDPSRADNPVCLGYKAPELHYVKGDWYICFSINDQGTGLLKSTSGKPEGPYEAWAQITLHHGSPSIFWDEKDEFGGDGSVYWLYDGGWCAKMNDDLTALVERPKLLQPMHELPPTWVKNPKIWRDTPDTVGDHGVFLFKNRGRYFLTAAERTNRLNASCDDTFIAYADKVDGPYSDKCLMVAHGGGVTVFRGPRSTAVPKFYYPQQSAYLHVVPPSSPSLEEIEKAAGDETLYATFFGNDDRAIFRDRPSFLPLEWSGPVRSEMYFQEYRSFPRKPVGVFTERGPWSRMKPLLPDETVRDIKVCVAPDGNYYFSGGILNRPGKLWMWKSGDLAHWTELPPLWSYEQIEWLEPKLPYTPPGEQDWKHIFWHTWSTYWNKTFYITFCIFGGDKPEIRGTTALKSTTGKIEGPYVSLGKVGGVVGQDPGPNLFIFHEYKGNLYAWDWKHYKNAVAKADLDKPGWKWDWKLADGGIYEHMQRGDCSHVLVWDNVPVFMYHSSGRLDAYSERHNRIGAYDVNYLPMKSLYGPPYGKPRTIPHVAACNFFKDHKGYWWSSFFGSDNSAPWRERFGLVPLHMEKTKDDLIVDVEMHPDEYQLKIMGAGEIAKVKTVLETLP